MDDFAVLKNKADIAAPRLLGCILEREIDGEILRGKITEVEAYNATDEASHSFRGKTERTAVMFGPAGHLYVYFTYGMHFCANIVVGKNEGAAVLIRAVKPLGGEKIMIQNRGGKTGKNIANGPAKFCQAFRIDKHLNGHDLRKSPLKLIIEPEILPENVEITPRIGISKAKDTPWRFLLNS